MAREAHNHVYTSNEDSKAAKDLADDVAKSTGRKTSVTDGSGKQQTSNPKK